MREIQLRNSDSNEPGAKKTNWWLWVLRVVVYVGTFFICFEYLVTVLPKFLFWASAIPVAAVAIGLEIFLSSRIQKKSIEEIVGARVLAIDHVLAGDDSLVNRQLEEKKVQELRRAEARRLEKGNSAWDDDQDYWQKEINPSKPTSEKDNPNDKQLNG